VIECGHWRACFERYDRPYTFFYLDPPYWQTDGYGVDFPWAEYEAIAAAMRGAKGKMLLSINDHPDIRALFAGLWMEGLSIDYTIGGGVNGHVTRGELVIANYAPGGDLFG
jgi:DNA adenine methylase